MRRLRAYGLLGWLAIAIATQAVADDDTEPLLENARLTDTKALFEGKSVQQNSGLQTDVGMGRTPSFQDQPKVWERGRPVETKRKLEPDPTKSEVQKLASSLGRDLSIFGQKFFKESPSTFAPLDMVAPPSEYRVAIGDVLDLKVWGAVSMYKRLTVDGSGQIFIPQVGPVDVVGVKFGNLDAHLKQAIGRQFKDFQVQTNLGRQNSLQVYVTGNARASGAYTIGGFSTMMNVLLACGGPSSNGSVREVELRRGDVLVGKLDLYKLLVQGDKSTDLSLQTGDVIHIPPVRKQVGISEGVVNPAIYEVKDGETLKDLIRWSGGLALGVDGNLARRERIVKDSGLKVEFLKITDSGKGVSLSNGEILQLPRSVPKFENSVTLRGQVRMPGRYPWKPGMTVRDLLPKVSDLIDNSFWDRFNKADGRATFAGLEDGQRLDINWDYAMIERMALDSLDVAVKPFNLGKAMRGEKGADVPLEPGDVVTIFGSQDLAVPVENRSIFVRLEGEVRAGGMYRAKHGETLKDLLRRAGGLTENAYLFGAKLTRKSAREIQKENYKKVVDEMERQFEGNVSSILASATSVEESKLLKSQVDAQRQWFQKLRLVTPDGRLVLELEPSEKLNIDDLPEVPLEDGDVFSVPSPGSMIGVMGEVANPSSFLYSPDQTVGRYLKRAGGGTRFADLDQAFVLRADGSVVGETDYGFLFWQLSSMDILPGDAVIVPRKMETTRWLTQVKDWSQILANFGLSAAAIATLSRGF